MSSNIGFCLAITYTIYIKIKMIDTIFIFLGVIFYLQNYKTKIRVTILSLAVSEKPKVNHIYRKSTDFELQNHLIVM